MTQGSPRRARWHRWLMTALALVIALLIVAAFAVPSYLRNREACTDWQALQRQAFLAGVQVGASGALSNPATAGDTFENLNELDTMLAEMRPLGCPT